MGKEIFLKSKSHLGGNLFFWPVKCFREERFEFVLLQLRVLVQVHHVEGRLDFLHVLLGNLDAELILCELDDIRDRLIEFYHSVLVRVEPLNYKQLWN